MVGPDRVANAVALNSAVLNAARITGPALAGVIIAATSTSWVFLCNAVSFLVVVGALAAMDRSELRPLRRERQPTGVRDGLRHTWGVREMRSTIALVAVVGTLVYNFPTFLTIMAKDTFGGNADVAGGLMAVLGVGTIIGALTAAHRSRQTRATVIAAGGWLGAALLLSAVIPLKRCSSRRWCRRRVCGVLRRPASAHCRRRRPRVPRRTMAVVLDAHPRRALVAGPLLGGVSDHWGARTGLGVAGVATAVTTAALALWARRGEGVDVDEVAAAESTEAAIETAT